MILSALPLAAGGIEEHLLLLFQAARPRFRVTLLSLAAPGFLSRLEGMGIASMHWQVDGLIDVAALIRLIKNLRSLQPDIVHIHDARAGFLGRPLISAMGIPLVYTVHLPSYLYWRLGKFQNLINRFYALVEAILNHLATDRVVYVGSLTMNEAVRRRITPVEKAVLIPNGIDLDPFQRGIYEETAAILRAEGGALGAIPVIACVARLTAQKNHELLLCVAARLKAAGYLFRLWLIGDGEDRIALEKLSVTFGVDDCVHFWGTRADVACLLMASDLFVLLSRYEGGRTLSIMEAQAAGKPCIVSDAGDHRLMIEDGLDGFVVPVGEIDLTTKKIMEVLSDQDLRYRFGAAARKKAFAQYDFKFMTDGVLRLYKELLDGVI